MKYLQDIPEMRDILANLPDNLTYVFKNGIIAKKNVNADFCSDSNVIEIDTKKANYYTTQGKFDFLIALAHELCHANQYKMGLMCDNLKNASFGESFRVGKMEEIEALLLNAIVSRKLLEKPEFKNCNLPCEYFVFDNKLKQTYNKQKAKKLFVLSYWTNSPNTCIEFNQEQYFKCCINKWYTAYTVQAYEHALGVHTGIVKTTNNTEALQAIITYCQRMGLKGINYKYFLQNRFDNTKVSESAKYKYQLTVFNQKQNIYGKYKHIKDDEYMVEYFSDNPPEACDTIMNKIRQKLGHIYDKVKSKIL